MHEDIYAVYKGEKLIVIGTEKEICRKLHWTRSTFKWEAYPSIMAKHGAMKNRLCLVKLENDPIGEVEELLIHETEKGVRYYACSDCTFKKSTRMEVFVFQSRGSIIMFMKQKSAESQ